MIIVVALLALVACGDKGGGDSQGGDAQLTRVEFSKDMTKEQICEIIEGLDNFTIEYTLSEANKDGELPEYPLFLFGRDFFVYSTVWQFVEGNRAYAYAIDTKDNNAETIMITDYTGYDAKDNLLDVLAPYQQDIIKALSTHDYAIVDGNLKIFKYEGDEYDIIVKDCNSTVLTIPEAFSDYKTREATEKVIEYKLAYDQKSYDITIDGGLRSFEIPAEYNGLPVSFTIGSVRYLEEVTLQSSITKLEGSFSWDGTYEKRTEELHVIFKGTKEQWGNIEKNEEWTSVNKVRVTCSDGEYVE